MQVLYEFENVFVALFLSHCIHKRMCRLHHPSKKAGRELVGLFVLAVWMLLNLCSDQKHQPRALHPFIHK